MGSSASKKTVHQGDSQENTLVQNPHSFVEKSSGFHIIEVHMPSVGFSMTAFVIALIIFAALFAAYRRFVRKQEQRRILTAYYRRSGIPTVGFPGLGQQLPRFTPPPFAPPPAPPLPRRNGLPLGDDPPPRYQRVPRHHMPRSRESCPCSDNEN